jgi:transposase-like protein
MKNRQWTSKQKSQIILEGLSGTIEITKLCQKYQIAQTQYYKWRDQFLANCHESFETKKKTDKEQRLEAQIDRMRNIIGGLTIELKKSEYEL